MNKAKELLSVTTESKNLSAFHDGATIQPSDFEGIDGDELAEYLMENRLSWKTEVDDIIEMHLYSPDGNEFDGSWPVGYEKDGKIILESLFGNGNESQVICKQATLVEL